MTNPSSSNVTYNGRFVLHDRREEIEHAERTVLEAVSEQQYDRASVFAIRLAMEEALSNAFKHGNKGDCSKVVRLECRVEPDSVVIDVEDQGEGFDPESIPDPTEQENLEIPAGRGLKLIKAMMTEVQIPPPGNRVRMLYARPDHESATP